MTYSIDYHKQGLSSTKDGMTIQAAASFYSLSTNTIHSWQQNLIPKTTRNKVPTKIPDDALLEDVKKYTNAYNYKRAHRLNCSSTDILMYLSKIYPSNKI